jgi:hypothetical protein
MTLNFQMDCRAKLNAVPLFWQSIGVASTLVPQHGVSKGSTDS